MTEMIIVVPSHISYSDAWGPFTKLFARFWPDSPYPGMIVSSGGITDATTECDGWVIKQYPTDWSWCQRLLVAVPDDNSLVLVLQEDFFLTATVNSDLIDDLANFLDKRDWLSAMRLAPIPGPNGNSIDPNVAMITKNADYCVSCQATIWRAGELRNLLRAIMARCSGLAADFEIVGTQLSRSLNQDFACWKRESKPWPLEYICSAITRGKWNPDALELCKRLGIAVDTSKREVMA